MLNYLQEEIKNHCKYAQNSDKKFAQELLHENFINTLPSLIFCA